MAVTYSLHPLHSVLACWTSRPSLSTQSPARRPWLLSLQPGTMCVSCVLLLLLAIPYMVFLVLNDISWPHRSNAYVFVAIGTFHSRRGVIFDFSWGLFILSSLLIFQYDNTRVSNLPHFSFSHVSYLWISCSRSERLRGIDNHQWKPIFWTKNASNNLR